MRVVDLAHHSHAGNVVLVTQAMRFLFEFRNSQSPMVRARHRYRVASLQQLGGAVRQKMTMSCSFPYVAEAGASARDREIDSDGLVSVHSGVAVDQCVKALSELFGTALVTIAKALKAAGYICDQVARGLKQLRNDAGEVAKALKQAGFDPLTTAKALLGVFSLSTARLTQILVAAFGLTVAAVGDLLQQLVAPAP